MLICFFIEKGIQGGLCQCSNHYAEANNKYLPTYNPGTASSYLFYLDINNLMVGKCVNHYRMG